MGLRNCRDLVTEWDARFANAADDFAVHTVPVHVAVEATHFLNAAVVDEAISVHSVANTSGAYPVDVHAQRFAIRTFREQIASLGNEPHNRESALAHHRDCVRQHAIGKESLVLRRRFVGERGKRLPRFFLMTKAEGSIGFLQQRLNGSGIGKSCSCRSERIKRRTERTRTHHLCTKRSWQWPKSLRAGIRCGHRGNGFGRSAPRQMRAACGDLCSDACCTKCRAPEHREHRGNGDAGGFTIGFDGTDTGDF